MCERVGGGFLREPVNTLGNLGFVAAGSLMFQTTWKSISTMFSSVVSISPSPPEEPERPTPMSSDCSRVTGMTS